MIIAMILILAFGLCIGLGIGYGITNPNDWSEVWSDIGEWTVVYAPGIERTERAVYTIYYSKSRNRYKLKCGGYDPKENHKYTIACNKLHELNSKL